MNDRTTSDEKPDYAKVITNTTRQHSAIGGGAPARESPIEAARRVDASDKEADRDLDREVIAERATLAVMVDQLELGVHGVNRPEMLCRRAIKRALDLLYASGSEQRPDMIKMNCEALSRMLNAGDTGAVDG